MDAKHLSGHKILVVAIIFLFLIAPAAAVIAQEWLSSADPEYVPPVDVQGDQIIGDDPDEDGYQGPVLQGEPVGEPSGDGVEPEWEFSPQDDEPQPDEDAYYEGVTIDNQTNGYSSEFSYIFVPGSVLKPRDSTARWTSSADGGCIYSSDPWIVYNVDIQIPEDARIDYLRIYYYDTSSNNASAWVTTYNGAGGLSDLISVTSSGNTGYGYVVSEYLGHVVDNASNPYVLNWRPNQSGNSMRLCGLRVAYRLWIP